MDKRLQTILDRIVPGTGVADIGTDHGYLPIALALKGYNGNLYASDKREEPLRTARKNASLSGVSEQIHFSLSDGLDDCPPDRVDTIVIAGMGGDEICSIIDRAGWVWDFNYRLLLQPMSKSEILRYFLCNNGFSILEDLAVCDGGRVYPVMEAKFTGNHERYSDAELFVGKKPTPESIAKTLRYLEKKPKDDLFDQIIMDLRRMQLEYNAVL